MPWVIGIDEAGYGPNLGPLVQAAVSLWVPADDLAGWKTYSHCVRRCKDAADDRLLIDDSKKVHSGPRKLGRLERTVLALTANIPFPDHEPRQRTFRDLLSPGCNRIEDDHPDVVAEHWYNADFPIPDEWDQKDRTIVFDKMVAFVMVGMAIGIEPRLVTTPAFNRIIGRTGNKADVTSEGLIDLLRLAIRAGRIGALTWPEDPVVIFCDKQGGRHYYGSLLQDAFPEGWVVTDRESADESRYRVMNLDREVTVIFRPRADGDSISVALASMTAKYLREICMKQFNAYWAQHVPGLKPTAGYPVDAKRFYREIEPAMKKLGIDPNDVWRMK